MELIQILSMIFVVYSHRSKIYNKMNKSKVGLLVMSPIMIPYVIYGLIRLSRNHDFSVMVDKYEKQKKTRRVFTIT
jgi:hypothetical protein